VPALTTLRMPIAEIVGFGVARAVSMAKDPSGAGEPDVTVFDMPLVVRDSTAPAEQS
jgi:DNA-binding LacI/PurR family transcriptional regulator